MIAKLRHFVPSSALTNIYKSSILTYLTYGLVAWGNTSKNYLNKVVVLQKRVLIEKNMQSPCLKMRKFCLLPSYIMKLYVNECSMFITTVHLLISWNLLRELQTSIHALLAHQRHNSIAFSTLGLKCKKSLFVRWCHSLEWETQWILKFVKNSFKKETKRALLDILETEDTYMEPDEIMLKFKHSKIESNSTSSSIFFVHLETLGLFLLHNEHLPFSFFLFLRIFLPFMCRKLFKSSILVNILWRIELQSNSITSYENDGGSSKRNFFLRDTQKANAQHRVMLLRTANTDPKHRKYFNANVVTLNSILISS